MTRKRECEMGNKKCSTFWNFAASYFLTQWMNSELLHHVKRENKWSKLMKSEWLPIPRLWCILESVNWIKIREHFAFVEKCKQDFKVLTYYKFEGTKMHVSYFLYRLLKKVDITSLPDMEWRTLPYSVIANVIGQSQNDTSFRIQKSLFLSLFFNSQDVLTK